MRIGPGRKEPVEHLVPVRVVGDADEPGFAFFGEDWFLGDGGSWFEEGLSLGIRRLIHSQERTFVANKEPEGRREHHCVDENRQA